ncbi:MAG: sigma-70 family RNA polymerase sigma factor [Planctomycetota bacterium]|nr:sigma-70 family RNA polymerase sigma factor [Planctomycetota bacterium]
MGKTDKNLIDAHLQGDQTAFGELVRRYGDSLLGYLTKICRNREQAKDLFQETFRKVHEKAHMLRSNRFKSWLYTIATRVAMDGLRKGSRVRMVSLNQQVCRDGDNCSEPGAVALADDCLDPSQEAVRAEQKELVRQALESLPDRQRVTVVLAYYQGLTYPEVATALGCSVGTVKTQMFRALRTLAQRLPDISGVAK